MSLAQIVVLAVLLEGIWETAKMVWKDRKVNINQVGTLAIGIALALMAKADLPCAVGLELPAIAGQIITGILISRGSNYLHDLVSRLSGTATGGTE